MTHRLDWGQTPAGKRYAVCTCGWRAPARSKLTHGISDARDHLAEIKRRCAAQGWEWWMVKPLGIVTEEPDPAGEGLDQVDVAEVGDPRVSLPHTPADVL